MDEAERDGGRVAALRLAEAVTQRVCHDLAGPLMGLTAALDMVGEDAPGCDGPADLLADAAAAARTLASRLRLVRAAWGGDDVPMDVPALTALTQGLAGGRVHADLMPLATRAPLAPGLARTLLAVLVVAAEALPEGGRVIAALPGGGDVAVALDGARAAWPAGLAASLAATEAPAPEDDAGESAGMAPPDGAPAGTATMRAPTARTASVALAVMIARANAIRLRLLLGPAGQPPILLLAPAH